MFLLTARSVCHTNAMVPQVYAVRGIYGMEHFVGSGHPSCLLLLARVAFLLTPLSLTAPQCDTQRRAVTLVCIGASLSKSLLCSSPQEQL